LNNEKLNGAGHAIDLDLGTYSSTAAGSDGTSWLKITLDKVNCIEEVISYSRNGNPFITWTCTDTDCSNCVGRAYCSYYTLTVSTEGAVYDLSPVSDCKHGDTVKLAYVGDEGFNSYEIAVIGKEGTD